MVNGPVVFDHLSLLLLLIGCILFSFPILNFYGLIVSKYFAHSPGRLAVILMLLIYCWAVKVSISV